MFRLAPGLIGNFNQDISLWNTTNVNTLFFMFAYNTVYKTFEQLGYNKRRNHEFHVSSSFHL